MSKIRILNGSFHYPNTNQLVFEGLNLDIEATWKSGIVARNGMGKTTLLKLIHGDLKLTTGDCQKEIETAFFPITFKHSDGVVLELMKKEIGPYVECEQVMAAFLQGEASEEDYYEALNTYLEYDGYEIESKIKKEIHRLNLSDDILSREYETLSGGEQTKIQMVILFLRPQTFVLLDEPTNHLDKEGIEQLSNYLKCKSGFLLVSHHRHFLDACVDHIIALQGHSVVVQQGNYSSYEYDYELKREFELKQRDKIEKDIRRLEEVARDRRNWSNAREKEKIGAGDKGFVSHRAAKMMKRALHVERRIDQQLQEKKELIKHKEHIPYLKITQHQQVSVLYQVSHLNVSYGEKMILRDISFTLEAGERLVIEGPNGSGKTTLIKSLLEQIPYDGMIKRDNRVKVAYVSQFPKYQSGFLRDILQIEKLEEARFRSILGALSCHRDIFLRDLSSFSLGELKKVEMARSLYNPSQVLIWDEPLNGLDILSRKAIEEAILQSEPTMIFIEHDETFIEKIATKRLVLS
ncbi:ATP-binding cassette domain-containing protein [Turicibacter sanguinis]|nr:ATP-binding cassette domain-containing protein [Turicibacter sanguinis]MTN50932.1 ATP-binding cassette domain-containing protein [Turicibacter sanguinis]MTN54172.1 ATP-binding cassette domain-containing protein [Turicibacter sanguinis]MTN57305.1 ATP-binding cassette domain-containing protein [Turicibacter sanguinis]MTN60370.1 ATP-binding cassette domain-containing protein [Turicibacter sanguinis]